jgi:hypothetical protein
MVELGNHDELMIRDGLYRHLHDVQAQNRARHRAATESRAAAAAFSGRDDRPPESADNGHGPRTDPGSPPNGSPNAPANRLPNVTATSERDGDQPPTAASSSNPQAGRSEL